MEHMISHVIDYASSCHRFTVKRRVVHLPFCLTFSVLPRCAADTPIEEFTPTPAFPALQYLESVDEGGVAWQAGLRTGDFLIEVRAAPCPFAVMNPSTGETWLALVSGLTRSSLESCSTMLSFFCCRTKSVRIMVSAVTSPP